MSSFEVVATDQIHQIIAPIAEQLLVPLGFESHRPLHWLKSDDAPIRQVFCLRQWKGGALAPAWGLSLDFVPHVSGSRLRWHRTVKSARLDITVNAHGRDLDMSYIRGAEPVLSLAAVVASKAVTLAIELWKPK